MEVIDLPGDRSSSPASRLSSKKTMWMLRVKNKQTIFARNLVCLRKRPPAEKMSHSLFQLNQTKTSHLNTITCRIVLIKVHTSKTPRRIATPSYPIWSMAKSDPILHPHFGTISQFNCDSTVFSHREQLYILAILWAEDNHIYIIVCKNACWTRRLTLISYQECLKTMTKVWKRPFLGYFSILTPTPWILGLLWWFLCQNVLKKGPHSVRLSLK